MVLTQIQLTDEQDHFLEELATTSKTSKGDLIRRAVDFLISNGVPESNPTLQRRQAMTIAGRFRSDNSDVAEAHDAYLILAYKESDIQA